MKRYVLLILILVLVCTGCGSERPMQESELLDLDRCSEESFLRQLAAMFADTTQYENVPVRITGCYAAADGYEYIYRLTSQGEPVGFELRWTGLKPMQGDEITAQGRLVSYLEGDARYLMLEADRLWNRTALRAAERFEVSDESFLVDLAAIYEQEDVFTGKLVSISGRFVCREENSVVFCSVERTAQYEDGVQKPVGLEFTWDDALPEPGAWVHVIGLLYYKEGVPVVDAAELICGAGGAEVVRES